MKILCIGRNYADHIKELNNAVPDEPVIFIKPDSAVLRNNGPFFIPDFSNEVHHEVEVILKIQKAGKAIPEQFAHEYYQEIGLGIDFTARDLQQKLKEKGLPWEKAKGFDYSAVIGTFYDKAQFNLNNLNFSLLKNGETAQKGNSSLMINSFDKIIAHVSQYFTLKIGDLIFTGTPAGVSKVASGDVLVGYLEEHKAFECLVQ